MALMDHVRYLCETIGPRGSTTPQEKEAARYAADVLRKAGQDSVTETFRSAQSAWYPSALFCGLMLSAVTAFWVGGRPGAIVALALVALAIASILLEMAFRPNPLRWLLPTGPSQNVWARFDPRDKPREQVVLLGHLDSHRTPLVFSSERWQRLFRILVPAGLVSTLLLAALLVVGIFSPFPVWRLLSLPPAAAVLGLLAITLQADGTPYTAGANDNATGAAVVLEIAERLAREPLAHTAVWTVLTGCEEVGCYGADAFARAHRDELGRAMWIPVDSVGGAGGRPSYVTSETFLFTARSDPGLMAAADRVAESHPELDVGADVYHVGAYTEGSIGAKHGFRVLTLMALHDGAPGEWHRQTDTVDHVDPDVVARTEAFVWALLHEIDAGGLGQGS
jgi:hypothetical protein